MEIEIRRETKKDYKEVENLTREAFWNHHVPGCDEHYLAHVLRESKSFIKQLDYVAIYNDKVVGNIMYTEAYILGDDGIKHDVISFGPLSVLPEFQNKGIGKRLIEFTKLKARELGYTALLIYGDPEYYKRTGFVSAEKFGIGTAYNTYAEGLLAVELVPDALKNCKGLLFLDDAYELDSEKAEEFERSFAPKEKINGLQSQVHFAEMLLKNRPRIND